MSEEELQRQMSTRDYLRLLWRRKWLLLLVMVGCVVAALVYNAVAQPVFAGRAELLVESQQGAGPSILTTAAPMLSLLGQPRSVLGGADLATQVQIINSRPVLEQAYGLLRHQSGFLQRVRKQGLSDEDLQALPETLDLLPASPPPSAWPEKHQEMLDTLLVSGIEDSQVIEVRCESTDRELATDFVNALSLAYLGRSLADGQAAARRSRRYVEDELADTEAQLSDAEQRLRRFGEDTGTVALDATAQQAIGLLAKLDEQAAAAEAQMKAQAALERDLLAQLATQEERIIASTIISRNPEIAELQKALAEAEAERASLLAEYTEESPLVRRATAKVDELRQRLAQASEEIIGSREEVINPIAQETIKQAGLAHGESLAAGASLAVVRRAIGKVEAELSKMPKEQVTLLRLQREVQLLEKIYLALKEKQQEYEIAEKTKMPASSLIEQAIVPDEPIRPKRFLNLAVAIVAGGLLGLLLVALAEHFDEGFSRPEELASALGVPVLAVLGGGWQRALREGLPDTGPVREAVESVLSHVRGAGQGAGGPTVVLFVPVAGTGDTSVIAEAVLRANAQHGGAGLLIAGNGPGLAELAAGDAALDEVAEPLSDDGSLRGLGLGAEPMNALSVEQVQHALMGSAADMIAVVCPAGSRVAAVQPLLRGGWPALVVVAMRGGARPRAARLVQLLSELGAVLRGAIVTGAPRCEAEYYPPGARSFGGRGLGPSE